MDLDGPECGLVNRLVSRSWRKRTRGTVVTHARTSLKTSTDCWDLPTNWGSGEFPVAVYKELYTPESTKTRSQFRNPQPCAIYKMAKPVWILCCFLLIGTAELTLANKNEAEEILIDSDPYSSSYMMAYPIDERTPEDSIAIESSVQPVVTEPQDKNKIDETLLLFLPSEEKEKPSMKNQDNKESTITGMIQTVRTVIQSLPTPQNSYHEDQVKENRRPKEKDVQSLWVFRFPSVTNQKYFQKKDPYSLFLNHIQNPVINVYHRFYLTL
ncbi:uncharacterized protein LOC143250665 isoform X2 [Tachypleus tridentatus]|uniref:uncharacterized protein LOC143250665 isoform X2 n=1 Tax=Tachypleus tridentatus TaxID=6853 RepID=UPI003FD4B52B